MLSHRELETFCGLADAPDVVGIGLTGSHARGEATPYSDVDLLRFTRQLPESGTYTLRVVDGRLISISTTTIEQKRADLTAPQEAIWTVMGLRQMRILKDTEEALAALQREAFDFQWAPLQAAADRFASAELMGYAEEVHKIIGARMRGDESAMLYGTLGLVLGLTDVVAVQRGVLLMSENSFFSAVSAAVGADWSKVLRVAAGFEAVDVVRRAEAALDLYVQTCKLLEGLLLPEHAEVIHRTLQVARDTL